MGRDARDKSGRRSKLGQTLGVKALTRLIQAVARYLDAAVLQELMRSVGAQLGRQALSEYRQRRHLSGRLDGYTWAECLKEIAAQFGWTLRVAVESDGVIRVTVLGCRLAESSGSGWYLCEFGSGLCGGAMAEAIGDVKVCESECSKTPPLNCAFAIYYRETEESRTASGVTYRRWGDPLLQQDRGQPDGSLGARLTSREAQVLQLIVHGLPDKEIAGALQLSVRTVENHAARIRKKLRVGGNRAALVRFALQSHLVEL